MIRALLADSGEEFAGRFGVIRVLVRDVMRILDGQAHVASIPQVGHCVALGQRIEA